MSQKTHTHLDSLERPGKLDGPLWLSARQVFSRERTWAFSILPWRHATCLSPVPHLSHWVSWRSSQQFFLLIALLSHHSKAVWTAQQFPFTGFQQSQGKRTGAANRGALLSPALLPAPLLCPYSSSLPTKEGFVAGDKPSTPSIKSFFYKVKATLLKGEEVISVLCSARKHVSYTCEYIVLQGCVSIYI